MKSPLTTHQQKSSKMPKSSAPLVCLMFFKLFLPLNVWALDLPNFWETMDKQAYDQFQKKHYEAAEDLFENPVWRGVALYKLGRYQEAIHAFKKVQTPLSLYNLGNSHTQLGQFKQAEKAYQQALKLTPEPELKPKIEHNLKLIQKILKLQATASKSSKLPNPKPSSNAKPTSPPKQAPKPKMDQTQPNKKSVLKTNNTQKPATDENATSNTTPEVKQDLKQETQAYLNSLQNPAHSQKQKSQGKSGTQAQNTEQNFDANEQDTENLKLSSKSQNPPPKTDKNAAISSNLSQSPTEQKQAQQTWLNQIPDQPELFVKRKFDYQYQQQKQRLKLEKIW